MKILLSISLSLIILVQTWDVALIWAYYRFNQDYIAETFCINKVEPELLCSGKCYVSDLIIEKSATTPNNWFVNIIQEFTGQSIFWIDQAGAFFAKTSSWRDSMPSALSFDFYSFLFHQSLLDPPRFF